LAILFGKNRRLSLRGTQVASGSISLIDLEVVRVRLNPKVPTRRHLRTSLLETVTKMRRAIFTFGSCLFLAFAQFASAIAESQQVSDPRVADLVHAGKIRVGVHSVMYTKDPRTGEPKAASVGIILLDIGRALSARIGVEIVLVGHPTIPEMLTCLTSGACDMAFMGPDPSRTGVDFSPPILQLDYTLLVPAGSSIQRIADVDRPGVRVAAVKDHASTLALSRIIKHAQLVYAATPDPTFELLLSGQADAFASIRGVLLTYSAKLPGSRVLDEHYGANLLGMAVPKGEAARLAYISEFIEQAKASGLIQQATDRSGLPGYKVVSARTN
jgi:polar amino acid transport system substrate-binding protein